MNRVITIVYAPGAYGSFIGWALDRFNTIRNNFEPPIMDNPLQPDGSSHGYASFCKVRNTDSFMEELEKCQGVSKGKSIKYGKPCVEMIAKYVEENDIEKPDDFVMRSVVNKSSNKVYIIQNVDKKIPLETIAKHKSLKLDELLEEMETIAASGTKLNLDYAIDEWLDENDQEDIIDYFKSCETSSLEIAQKELSENDYTLEQLKIMRIKFLSVYGN